ncbi:MAG: TetR/AcrR family transcriptional regulator [Clostridiales bacterium]|nr:TetR/AcrR family transcriptional regulator [Clostridiales bacterium]
MTSEGTKERILNTALEMFSEKGYSAVSMRDISGAVGIRASSLYYYFKGKQDIFDALIARAEALKDGIKESFAKALGHTESIKMEDFVRIGGLLVTGYYRSEKIAPLLQMLESERFHDEKADETWKKMLFSEPIENHTQVFRMLYEKGLIKEKDAEGLAAEYQGIIVLGYFTNDIGRVKDSLTSFYKRYFK